MPFDFAQVKALARQTVHDALAVRAFYEDASTNPPVEVRARWHNKIDRFGDLDSQSYAELIQGVDRIIFDAGIARSLNIKRGGIVTFPDYSPTPTGPSDDTPLAFTLMVKEPSAGPVSEVWVVARKEKP